MYGTVARMKTLPGAGEQLGQQMQEDRPPGMVAVYVFQMDADPDEYMMAVAFESKEAYVANASSPEQNERYEKMRALLAEDPEWHDGEIVHADTP